MSSRKLLTFIDLKTGDELDALPCRLAVAIGNFDGVHLGHVRLISASLERAERKRASGVPCEAGVFCFSVPPADILSSSPPPHICSLERKLDIFRELGVRYALIGDFARLKDIEAEDFCEILKNQCNTEAVICGFNFRFGALGKGDIATLRRAFGEDASALDAITTEDGIPISSSRIRVLLAEGRIDEANRLLGRPYALEGEVIHGKALGRRLGVPTLNQRFGERSVLPLKGIYVSLVLCDEKKYEAVSNIGSRPTVDADGEINCETHLLDFEGELYGKKILTFLLKRLRDEKKFSSEEELKNAISADVELAKRYFKEKVNFL